MPNRKRAVALAALVASLSACSTASVRPLELAKDVDLEKVYGGWYIVATIPNWFEKGMVAPYDELAPRPDKDIREDFYVRQGSFAAPRKHFTVHDWIVPGSGNATWRVQVFWPLRLPFLMVYADPSYRYLLWGEENRRLGWIYSRTPEIDDETYRRLLSVFSERGYDSSLFRRVVQVPSQIGKEGFWNDGIKP